MRDLTQEEREFFEKLLKLKPQKRQGYLAFTHKKKHYKRSRVVIQLHLNKKLEMWEFVHHKDRNRENDDIENLEVINTEVFNYHSSMHTAGKRRKSES